MSFATNVPGICISELLKIYLLHASLLFLSFIFTCICLRFHDFISSASFCSITPCMEGEKHRLRVFWDSFIFLDDLGGVRRKSSKITRSDLSRSIRNSASSSNQKFQSQDRDFHKVPGIKLCK